MEQHGGCTSGGNTHTGGDTGARDAETGDAATAPAAADDGARDDTGVPTVDTSGVGVGIGVETGTCGGYSIPPHRGPKKHRERAVSGIHALPQDNDPSQHCHTAFYDPDHRDLIAYGVDGKELLVCEYKDLPASDYVFVAQGKGLTGGTL